MSINKCIVRLKDCHNTEHSVEVYAESLYEAVLRGLGRLGDVGWESETNETIKRVEVEIHQEPTKHIVDVPKLLNRAIGCWRMVDDSSRTQNED
jgi:hypothetical protein